MTRHRKAVVLEAWSDLAKQEQPMGPRDDTRVVGSGMRAEYPNADVGDALSFDAYETVAVIAARLGASTKEVQKALTKMVQRGSVLKRGRSYKIDASTTARK